MDSMSNVIPIRLAVTYSALMLSTATSKRGTDIKEAVRNNLKKYATKIPESQEMDVKLK